MSLTINNNTLTQIILRRGTDASRQQVILATGEIGYTTDTGRLFVGDGVTYGGNPASNKFLGYSSIASLSTIAQNGDLAFDPILNNLYVFTLSGFQIAGINYSGNLSNSGGSVSISNSFAGSGFKIVGAPGVLNLDSNFWGVSASGISFNKSVLTPVLSSTGRLTIGSAMTNQNISYPNINTADIVLNGSTFVNGTLSAAAGSIAINNTGVTTATTLSSYTTSPPIGAANGANLIIQSGGQSAPSTPFVNIQYAVDTSTWQTGLYIDARPFVGINTSRSAISLAANVLSTFNFAVSGNALFTNNVTVSGDLIADFQASDINLKDNITPITNALSKLLTLEGVNFNWKPDYKFSGSDIGVIAQQVEKVLPEAVKTRGDGYKGVDYEKIIPLLIEAIKELSSKIK